MVNVHPKHESARQSGGQNFRRLLGREDMLGTSLLVWWSIACCGN